MKIFFDSYKFTSFIFAFFISASTVINSQTIPEFKTQKSMTTLDFLSIKMPYSNEPNMGFTGIHYNLKFKNWYSGLGIYGAVSGIRGGFFTLGVNAGFKTNLTSKLFLDTGIHFGGGGGASAPDGGGAFILPHASLGYDFKYLAVTTGYSYVNFFDDGAIKSDQLYVSLQVPFSFDYTHYPNAEKKFIAGHLKNSFWEQISKRISVMAHLNNLSPSGSSQDINGNSLNNTTIRLLGIEINNYFSKKWFWLLKADGAFSGIPGGYMDIFLGAGYHFSMNKNRTNILAKFAVGAGGGGSVDSQGGALLYPDISIEQLLFDNFYISINKGFLLTPNRYFNTSTLGVGLKYYVNTEGTLSKKEKLTKAKFKGLNINIKQEVYSNAERNTNPIEDLYQISLQVDLFLKKYVYLAGQTSFANFGNAGAYAEGILGVGLQTKPVLNKKVSAFVQVLGGAAGGGNISTGQGLIVKPSVGLYYHLSNILSLRAAVGQVKANGGNLNSTLLNFGISYRFALLTAK